MRIFTSLLCAVLLAPTVRASDWTAYRSADRTGIAADANPPIEWSANKNIKWRAPLPMPGNSSPIVSGDRVFVSCALDARGMERGLFCFSRADGHQLWVQTVKYPEKEPTHPRNPYCGSTPAADGERVVVWHGSAGLHCYDYNGKELWFRDLGTVRHIWGYAASPVFYGDSILLNVGPGSHSAVVAVDRRTGEVLWTTPEPGGAEDKLPETGSWIGSWTTPVIARVDGQDQVIVAQPRHVNAYDPKSGKILWQCTVTGDLAYSDVMIGSDAGHPIGVAMAGYGGAAIGFKLGGVGDVTATNRLWRSQGRNPQRIGTGVVFGKYLFQASEPRISCIDMTTGEEIWSHPEPGQTFWGSVAAAGDRCYVTSQKGVTIVFAADPKAYHALAANDLGEPSNSTPALVGKQVFLRTGKAVYCVEDVP